jgi:hypothetical protein
MTRPDAASYLVAAALLGGIVTVAIAVAPYLAAVILVVQP